MQMAPCDEAKSRDHAILNHNFLFYEKLNDVEPYLTKFEKKKNCSFHAIYLWKLALKLREIGFKSKIHKVTSA